jgi:LAGLIDADG DNA endonuclease family
VSGPKGDLVGSREASNLTSRCSEILIGTVLGDGCLERNGKNVRLRIDHSVNQRAWVDWKFSEFSELSPLRPRLVTRTDPRTGHVHVNYRFSTRTSPLLNDLFSLFYGQGDKRIPGIIRKLLSPLALGVWYMDDGGRRGDCRSGYLNTNAYSVEDVELLKRSLQLNFGLATTTHFAAGKPRIYIPSSQFASFCEIVRPYVISEMRYKLL